jgi:hypothetical protein
VKIREVRIFSLIIANFLFISHTVKKSTAFNRQQCKYLYISGTLIAFLCIATFAKDYLCTCTSDLLTARLVALESAFTLEKKSP